MSKGQLTLQFNQEQFKGLQQNCSRLQVHRERLYQLKRDFEGHRNELFQKERIIQFLQSQNQGLRSQLKRNSQQSRMRQQSLQELRKKQRELNAQVDRLCQRCQRLVLEQKSSNQDFQSTLSHKLSTQKRTNQAYQQQMQEWKNRLKQQESWQQHSLRQEQIKNTQLTFQLQSIRKQNMDLISQANFIKSKNLILEQQNQTIHAQNSKVVAKIKADREGLLAQLQARDCEIHNLNKKLLQNQRKFLQLQQKMQLTKTLNRRLSDELQEQKLKSEKNSLMQSQVIQQLNKNHKQMQLKNSKLKNYQLQAQTLSSQIQALKQTNSNLSKQQLYQVKANQTLKSQQDCVLKRLQNERNRRRELVARSRSEVQLIELVLEQIPLSKLQQFY